MKISPKNMGIILGMGVVGFLITTWLVRELGD